MKNFGICGEMGAGKDFVAELMGGYIRKAFGDEIRVAAKNLRVNGAPSAFDQLCKMFDNKPPRDLAQKLKEFRNIPQTDAKDRKLLQALGTYCRLHKDMIWVDSVLNAISPDNEYVVTDCRRHAEFDALKAKGFVMIYVEADLSIRKQRLIDRDGSYDEAAFSHVSEAEINELMPRCDWILVNEGTALGAAMSMQTIFEEEGVV